MCYWFERTGDRIRCEVRQVGTWYELTVVRPDGSRSIEHFEDAHRLFRRQAVLEHRLAGDGWSGPCEMMPRPA